MAAVKPAGLIVSAQAEDKSERVQRVFDTASTRYDLMNDLMSLGLHRVLKRITLEQSGVRPGQRVLDLAGGTGDLTRLFARQVGETGRVVLADANRAMLELGRDRLLNQGIAHVDYVVGSAEKLPFEADTFDCLVCAFGLRNFSDQETASAECRRVLKPGGRCLILEFSRPKHPGLARAFRLYTSGWPALGRMVVGDAAPYTYLVESIESHPSPEAVGLMMTDQGFNDVRWHGFLGGVVTLHTGRA